MITSKKILLSLIITIILASITMAQSPPKIGGYFHTLYSNLEDDIDNLDIRRARIKISGDVASNVSYSFLGESAGTNSKLLMAVIDVKTDLGFIIRSGEFKAPLFKTWLISSVNQPTIFRPKSILSATSPIAATTIAGMSAGWEQGVQIMGKENMIEYAVGVFNGAGSNNDDTDEDKDIIGRLDFIDIIPGVEVGIGGLSGRNITQDTSKSAYSGHAMYKINQFFIQSEVFSAYNGVLKSQGAFITAGYSITPEYQLIAQYDTYDYDTDDDQLDKSKIETLAIGLNYFLAKNTKLMLNYVIPTEENDDLDNQAFYTQLQIVL